MVDPRELSDEIKAVDAVLPVQGAYNLLSASVSVNQTNNVEAKAPSTGKTSAHVLVREREAARETRETRT